MWDKRSDLLSHYGRARHLTAKASAPAVRPGRNHPVRETVPPVAAVFRRTSPPVCSLACSCLALCLFSFRRRASTPPLVLHQDPARIASPCFALYHISFRSRAATPSLILHQWDQPSNAPCALTLRARPPHLRTRNRIKPNLVLLPCNCTKAQHTLLRHQLASTRMKLQGRQHSLTHIVYKQYARTSPVT